MAVQQIKDDPGVVMAAILATNGRALGLGIDSKYLRDPVIVTAAVSRNGNMLRHAAPEMQADKDVVLAAVRQFGPAVQHASEQVSRWACHI